MSKGTEASFLASALPSATAAAGVAHALLFTPAPSESRTIDAMRQLMLVVRLDHRLAAVPLDAAGRLLDAQTWPLAERHYLLVRAAQASRRHQLVDAVVAARNVLVWADAFGDGELQAGAHAILSVALRVTGDVPGAIEHAIQATRVAPPQLPAWYRADMHSSLSLSLFESGDLQASQRRLRQAMAVLEADPIPELELALFNNAAYFYYKGGEYEAASAMCEEMLRRQRRSGVRLIGMIRDTVACVQIARGEYLAAVNTLRPVVDDSDDAVSEVSIDTLPYCLLTYAEAQRLLGQPAEAMQALRRAARVASARALVVARAKVHDALAALYAELGDYEAAYSELRGYLDVRAIQRDQLREARSAILHTLLEIDEVRTARDQAEELARHDPLTGLRNRRALDEELPRQIAIAEATRRPVTVALLDLDFFKAINDTYTHEMGDEVLRRVANILVASLSEADVPLRLGGEEFLVVLPECDLGRGLEIAEDVRQRIEAHNWSSLVPGLRATASIGVRTHRPGEGMAQLLSAADHQMYLAKRAGRNRVVGA